MKLYLSKNHRDTPNEELLDDLKRTALKLQRDTITMDEYARNGIFHSSTLVRRFGSWFHCLELAGLSDSRSRINIPDEELLSNLLDVWKHLGRQPKYDEIKKPLSKFSAGVYERRFGTWFHALEALVNYADSNSN